MSAAAQARGSQEPLASPPARPKTASRSFSSLGYFVRLLVIMIILAYALFLGANLINDGNPILGVTIMVTALVLALVNARKEFMPLRWMTPALALVALLVIYPFLYTAYIAFTNFSDGHRYTKTEAVALMSRSMYLPEGASSYRWEVYRAPEGGYALWLTDPSANNFFVTAHSAVQPAPQGDPPDSYEGYIHLTGGERFQALGEIQSMRFGGDETPIGIASRNTAGAFQPIWTYDAAQDALINNQTGVIFRADNRQGLFISETGDTAPLGFWVVVGLDNFNRIVNSSVIRGPLLIVFTWTVMFALLSVITSFAMGLTVALALNKPFPGVRVVRSLIIIPYAIPGIISVLIWRGMLNPNLGVLTTNIERIFGWAPPWFSDGSWARIAILLVNLWLAFPYFMLVATGALQAIPQSIYEAASLDGANAFQRFRSLTLPLLLVTMGPLLIASFTFNFTTFFLIEGLFKGGPPISGTSAPPVGYTDTLITYTFRFAFSAGGTRDYGFAAAIALVIFVIIGVITLFQFRITKRWEEIGENA